MRFYVQLALNNHLKVNWKILLVQSIFESFRVQFDFFHLLGLKLNRVKIHEYLDCFEILFFQSIFLPHPNLAKIRRQISLLSTKISIRFEYLQRFLRFRRYPVFVFMVPNFPESIFYSLFPLPEMKTRTVFLLSEFMESCS